ncbi:MAG: single-strand DNA-binding protein [Nitriliruptoraceae bacterium]|jgi:single-strand DNA-binding protein
MAFESNYVTFIGNLTDDPELRFTQSGAAVCTIRLASNRKWTSKDGQEQEETTFLNVNIWRELAENVAETFSKGDRAIAIGKLKVRSYENRDGQTVWVTEIEADEVAPSLRWAKAQINRGNSSGGSRPQVAGSNTPPPPSDDDVPF